MTHFRKMTAAPARFRLTTPAPLEQEVLEQIIVLLRLEQARRRVAWFARVNGGGMMDKTRRWLAFYRLYLPDVAMPVSKGMADLHGMLSGGRYFALEVKRARQTASPAQLKFLKLVRDGGGIGAVVHSAADVQSLLFEDAT